MNLITVGMYVSCMKKILNKLSKKQTLAKKDIIEKDVKELKMLCESCTIVDTVHLGKLPIGQFKFNTQIKNPFNNLANPLFIKMAVKAKKVNHAPANNEDFVDDENTKYQYVPFPPKFSVQYFTDNAESDKAKEKMKRLIKRSGLFSEIGAIGINYDLYIDNDLAKDLKDKILSDKISNECTGFGATLKFRLDDHAILNIVINQDVQLANSQDNVTLFNANIHILTNLFDNEKSFMDKVFDGDKYNINVVKEKIKTLL